MAQQLSLPPLAEVTSLDDEDRVGNHDSTKSAFDTVGREGVPNSVVDSILPSLAVVLPDALAELIVSPLVVIGIIGSTLVEGGKSLIPMFAMLGVGTLLIVMSERRLALKLPPT